jgi:signal transduction histidine kinase
MSKGGKLKIKTNLLDSDREVQIVVSDTGGGIPEEILPHIFEPFVSTKESTGLGLAVVYGIIQQHKGEIEVESKTNQGTTFIITLPRRPVHRQWEDRVVFSSALKSDLKEKEDESPRS